MDTVLVGLLLGMLLGLVLLILLRCLPSISQREMNGFIYS